MDADRPETASSRHRNSEPGEDEPWEPALVAQEHRLFHVVMNFWEYRHRPRGDPRRRASVSALIWLGLYRLIPGVAITSGGLVGLATVILLYKQNAILHDQIDAMGEQAIIMGEQATLQKQQMEILQTQFGQQHRNQLRDRRQQLYPLLWPETAQDNETPDYRAVRQRDDALREFIEISQYLSEGPIDLRGAQLGHTSALANQDLTNARFDATNLQYADISASKLHNAIFKGAHLDGAKLNNVDCYLTDFGGCSFTRVSIIGALIPQCTFTASDLSGSDFSHSNLLESYLDDTNLDGAKFMRSGLWGVILKNSRNWTRPQLEEARFDYTTGKPTFGTPEDAKWWDELIQKHVQQQ